MTRKDYNLIADSFVAARNSLANNVGTPQADRKRQIEGIDWAITHLSHQLENDNPRFDRNRFLHEAGFWTKHFEG
jgi:hypothetical protein